MTNKIMNYENSAYGSDWFNRIILVGGDSHHDTEGYNEGEVMSDKIINDYMTEFNPVKIYASYKDSDPLFTPVQDNIIRELSKGAGHIFFDGHANPGSWNTHWPGENSWTGGIQVDDFWQFSNKNMVPICNVEGCHNSQFNITAIGTFLDKDNSQKTWCYGSIVPECWSWHLARKPYGGAIATIGNTGLGYGAVGESGDLDGDGNNEPDTVEALGGYFFSMIYKTIDEGKDMLGDVWGGGIIKYMETYPALEDQLDAKEMEQLCLLGDPSLKIGGYPSTSNLRIEIDGENFGLPNKAIEQEVQVIKGNLYDFKWDIDEDGKYDDHTGKQVEIKFSSPGYYTISVEASNSEETITYDKIINIIKDKSPNKPQINGPKQGDAGKQQTFTIKTDDPYNDDITYLIDWGDGENTVIGPVESEEEVTTTHSWSEQGRYVVKVKAFDSFAGQSKWSDPYTIFMPKNKNLPILNTWLSNLLQQRIILKLRSLPIFAAFL
jgi:hypothetical protein